MRCVDVNNIECGSLLRGERRGWEFHSVCVTVTQEALERNETAGVSPA